MTRPGRLVNEPVNGPFGQPGLQRAEPLLAIPESCRPTRAEAMNIQMVF